MTAEVRVVVRGLSPAAAERVSAGMASAISAGIATSERAAALRDGVRTPRDAAPKTAATRR